MTDLLRLWKSEAVESFDFQAFNVGDYYRAVDEKVISETISKVLYPNDEPQIGKRLRLASSIFFVSCSLQDMIRIHLIRGGTIDTFHESFAVQLNDTHPSIAVAELMRLLVDEHQLEWETAWQITRRTLAYTNHTLLPEALEKWPLPLFRRPAPPPPGDHLRDQPALPGRGAAALSRGRRTGSPALAHRRERARSMSGWPTWPASAAMPSTAWRRSTPNS